ncbi:MAG: hypothetical protein ACE5GV_04750 [Candidatus Scalindua sp.]
MGKIIESQKTLEKIMARVLSNTLRQKRPNNLVEVANDIELLKQEMGSLEAVSNLVGISTDMLRQFLSVKRLSPEVRKLIKERKIDSVTIAHRIRNFTDEEQKTIAKEVIDGRLTSSDVRALVALKSKLLNLNVEQLISRVLKSKDIKIYVARFRMPSDKKENNKLRRRFENIIGKSEILSLNFENSVGVLEVTRIGLKKLREAAKRDNLSLRQFVDKLVEN